MKLQQCLRMEFNKILRPLLIKSTCEKCGTDKKLELHHVKQFAKTLQEILKRLEIKYNEDVETYTIKELQLIKDVMLSEQIRQSYLTLCDKCHDMIEVKRFKNTENSIIEYILAHDDGCTSYTYLMCMQPEKALKYIEDEFTKGNITLMESMLEYTQLSLLHPGYFKSKLNNKERDRLNDIVREVSHEGSRKKT